MQWLAELEKALGARDVAALQKLFHADSHWRDILALTWRIGTVSGAGAVAAKLLERAARAKPRGFALDRERTAPREVTRAGERCVEAILDCREALDMNVKPKFAVDALVARLGAEYR